MVLFMKFFIFFSFFSLCFLMASCYRMPTEDDFSVVPTTNNPRVTCEKQTGFAPGASF